jgi:hypothetical protein
MHSQTGACATKKTTCLEPKPLNPEPSTLNFGRICAANLSRQRARLVVSMPAGRGGSVEDLVSDAVSLRAGPERNMTAPVEP